jgi:hypothetical protein
MSIQFKSEYWKDENGYPDGGSSFGNGFAISWQRGLDKGEPNGACVEDILEAVADRIRHYHDSPLTSEYHLKALRYIDTGLLCLYLLAEERKAMGAEDANDNQRDEPAIAKLTL